MRVSLHLLSSTALALGMPPIVLFRVWVAAAEVEMWSVIIIHTNKQQRRARSSLVSPNRLNQWPSKVSGGGGRWFEWVRDGMG